MSSSSGEKKKESFGAKILGVVGWVVGAGVGKYAGMNLLVPASATFAVWWLGNKFVPEAKKIILPSFSFQAGHFIWLSFGVIYIGTLGASSFDLAIYIIGLTWLLIKPSKGSLYLLGVYQALSVAINVSTFLEATVGSTTHQALLVHIIWRSISLFFMAKLFLKLRVLSTEPNVGIAP